MVNTIIIQGRFKADTELRHTQSNTAVCTATLAVQRSRKDQNGEYMTDWIDVVFWGKTAEHVATLFHKGDMAIVRGRLESRKWQDKNGNNRVSWEVQAESVDFCGSKSETKQNHIDTQNNSDFTELADDDGNVPF